MRTCEGQASFESDKWLDSLGAQGASEGCGGKAGAPQLRVSAGIQGLCSDLSREPLKNVKQDTLLVPICMCRKALNIS